MFDVDDLGLVTPAQVHKCSICSAVLLAVSDCLYCNRHADCIANVTYVYS